MNHHNEQYKKSANRKKPQYALIELSQSGDWVLMPHRFFSKKSAIDFSRSIIKSHDACASSSIIRIYRISLGAVVDNLRGTVVVNFGHDE